MAALPAIWSERHVGVLIQEAKDRGVVGQPGPGRGNKEKSGATLALLLGTESDTEAKHISSRSQKLAEREPEEIEAAIAEIKSQGEATG